MGAVVRVAVCSAGPGPVLTDLSCLTPRTLDGRTGRGGSKRAGACHGSAAWGQCDRSRFRPHSAKAPADIPTSRTPAGMDRFRPPLPGAPVRAAAAWVGPVDRGTGLFQVDSDDGAAAVEDGEADVGVSAGSVSSGWMASAVPGTGAVGAGAGTRGGAAGADMCGAAVSLGAGWAGEPPSPGGSVGAAGLPGRPFAVLSGAGSSVGAAVVAAGDGSGESARAGAEAGRPMARARTAAEKAAGTARNGGEDGLTVTFRRPRIPRPRPSGFRSSLLHSAGRPQIHPHDGRPGAGRFSPGFRAAAPPGFSAPCRAPPRTRGPG
ncbi:hypothetical protein RM50_19280 [Pseudarthrobacter phenanthrenivorans]|uniref:Uncharacterized protein n=1 Tax=Pseudarthrobacter phenanthrenivorans TaxID=361575 RepID=A0A0B4CMY3_PSEPS|nr:hypothetical protein RM50_19280 [Pseudarthrobacter phenanthrenivorans]